jgi:hypothetical protein
MLAICLSCVYTLQPPTYGRRLFIIIGVVAVVVAAAALMARSRPGRRRGIQLSTALLAGIAYHLAYSPQLGQLPAFQQMPQYLAELQPGLGTAGLIVALIGAAMFVLSGSDRRREPLPFYWSILVAAGLLILVNAIMYIGLVQVYNLQGGFYARLLLFHAVGYGLLFLAVQRMEGAPAVGYAPTWYLAAAIILAAGRHILGIAVM